MNASSCAAPAAPHLRGALLLALLFCGGGAPAQEAGLPDAEVMRIHVVEKRPFTEAGRWELSFFGLTQVNQRFTVHAGLSAEIAYHLRENLAAQLGVSFFPLAAQSALAEELLTKASEAPESAEAFLLRADAVAGLELTPVYGKLDVFDGRILRFGVYLNAGLGAARTRLQLRPSAGVTGRTFGDTGLRPMASLGAGARVFVSERFTVRLELRDLAYSGYVSKVNGCSFQDLQAIQAAEGHTNPDGTPAPLSATGLGSGCNQRAFGAPGEIAKLNAAGARDLLARPSADVINNLALQGGVSWLF